MGKLGAAGTAFGKKTGSDKAGGDGSTAVSDPENKRGGIASVVGVREAQHATAPLGIQGPSGKDRGA